MPVYQVVLIRVILGPFLLFLESAEILLLHGQFEFVVLLRHEFLTPPVGGQLMIDYGPVLAGRDEGVVFADQSVDAHEVGLEGV